MKMTRVPLSPLILNSGYPSTLPLVWEFSYDTAEDTHDLSYFPAWADVMGLREPSAVWVIEQFLQTQPQLW